MPERHPTGGADGSRSAAAARFPDAKGEGLEGLRENEARAEAKGIAMLANARAAAVVEPARADRDVDSRDAEVRLASSPSFQAARVERNNAVEHENVVVSRSSLNPTCPTYRR